MTLVMVTSDLFFFFVIFLLLFFGSLPNGIDEMCVKHGRNSSGIDVEESLNHIAELSLSKPDIVAEAKANTSTQVLIEIIILF